LSDTVSAASWIASRQRPTTGACPFVLPIHFGAPLQPVTTTTLPNKGGVDLLCGLLSIQTCLFDELNYG
jgi:hypothetical protein